MKKIILLLLSFSYFLAYSQDRQFSILGKVVDSASGQPLAGASAFCQNTTYGTISNADGNFFMRLPAGGYDLVISYTGYEKQIMRISNSQPLPDTLIISLPKQDKSLTEVAVVATNEVADGWTRYGKFFIDNFIGTTPNAASCEILNPEALHFYYTKKRNRLKVLAKEDLWIVNKALGYKIRYQLDSFSYDYNSKVSQYTGSPLFEEMDSTREVKTQWVKNRARTYLGSRLHFMRSLYDSTVKNEGFIVEKLDDNDPKNTRGQEITDLYDSSLFSRDSGVAEIGWNGHYRVSYKKVFPDKQFIQEYNLPANSRAQVTLLNVDDGFVIEENGYFYPQYDVINSGYWAWKKVAEALPYDYIYE
jgi:hypothetical protein